MAKILNSNKHNFLVSIIIPLFNEGVHFKDTFNAIYKKIQFQTNSEELNVKYEFILINDGSSDNTWDAVLNLKKIYKHSIRAVSFSRNFGKDSAICAGLSMCSGDCAVIIDGDMQHPPNLIFVMVKSWLQEGFMLIEATKSYNRRNSNFFKRASSALFYNLLMRISGVDIRNSSDYKLIDRKAIDIWLTLKERSIFFRGTIAWLGFKSKKINFVVGKRPGGESGWNNLKLLKLAVSSLTSFSNFPLYLIPLIGIIFITFSLGLSFWIIYLKITNQIASGFPTLILINLISGGCVMIGLGIIGQYLGKIYDELKARPRYVIEKTI
jgi:polyisoprenyl-phosphate glycosyltransferase